MQAAAVLSGPRPPSRHSCVYPVDDNRGPTHLDPRRTGVRAAHVGGLLSVAMAAGAPRPPPRVDPPTRPGNICTPSAPAPRPLRPSRHERWISAVSMWHRAVLGRPMARERTKGNPINNSIVRDLCLSLSFVEQHRLAGVRC